MKKIEKRSRLVLNKEKIRELSDKDDLVHVNGGGTPSNAIICSTGTRTGYGC